MTVTTEQKKPKRPLNKHSGLHEKTCSAIGGAYLKASVVVRKIGAIKFFID